MSLYDLTLALWVGGMSLFTFIITPVIFKYLARDMARSIVGRLFPYYFLHNLALSGSALFLFLFDGGQSAERSGPISLVLLITALVTNLVTVTVIYPKMERLKADTRSFETTSSCLSARNPFLRLHALSSILNLIVLMEGVTLIVVAHFPPAG